MKRILFALVAFGAVASFCACKKGTKKTKPTKIEKKHGSKEMAGYDNKRMFA